IGFAGWTIHGMHRLNRFFARVLNHQMTRLLFWGFHLLFAHHFMLTNFLFIVRFFLHLLFGHLLFAHFMCTHLIHHGMLAFFVFLHHFLFAHFHGNLFLHLFH